MFIVLLTSLINASSHTRCVFLSNQKCKIQPTFINLCPNEYSQELHYSPLDRYVGSCNTLNDLSNKVCVPNKTEDLNIHIFNMITGINESKILANYISCECKWTFDERKCNSNQKWNNDKCRCECKNLKEQNACEKDYIWNLATCGCESCEYLAGFIDDSVIICDEIIKETKTIATIYNEKNITCNTQKNMFYLPFYWLL